MKKEDLIGAVSYIALEDERQDKIISALKAQMHQSNLEFKGRKNYRNAGTKAAVAALGLVLIGGMSLSAYALATSQLKERMEEMTPNTISELEEQVQSAEVQADSFNRPYSDTEQERMETLYVEYMGGRFPQGELTQVSSEDEAAAYEEEGKICFFPTLSRFYLPLQREMTDEEILEVLDYSTKRDYALIAAAAQEETQQVETQQVETQQVETQQVERSAAVAITEDQAIEIAAARAAELGLNLDGFTLNHYFDEGSERKDRYGGVARYGVNWSNIVSHTYYYFYINAADGSILDEDYNEYSRYNRKYKETAIQRNIDNGGISLEEAIKFARLRMEESGLDPDGYYCSTWFTENYSQEFDGKSYYQVTWTDEENRKFYVFFLDGKDGTILEEH